MAWTVDAAVLTAKFPGTCNVCKQRFPAGAAIVWAKGAGARHASSTGCEAALAAKSVAAPAPTVQVGEFAGVIALFETAKASKLKWPKITLVCAGVPVKLAVAGPKSKTPGAVTIAGEGQYPYRTWYGTVSTDGAWTPARKVDPAFQTALAKLLAELSAAPATVAAEHGKLTGHCCFCNAKLGEGEDKRSIAVGYGPTCAKNYGLKAEWLKGATATEVAVAA